MDLVLFSKSFLFPCRKLFGYFLPFWFLPYGSPLGSSSGTFAKAGKDPRYPSIILTCPSKNYQVFAAGLSEIALCYCPIAFLRLFFPFSTFSIKKPLPQAFHTCYVPFQGFSPSYGFSPLYAFATLFHVACTLGILAL